MFEIKAFNDNHTWELVNQSKGKKALRCKWIFTIKVYPDSFMVRLKAKLVVKGSAQTYGLDYSAMKHGYKHLYGYDTLWTQGPDNF